MIFLDDLPISIRYLLESAVRNCDGFLFRDADVEAIFNWQKNQAKTEIPFQPARVLLQDFTYRIFFTTLTWKVVNQHIKLKWSSMCC